MARKEKPRRVLNIAHRGASGAFAENTLAAFRAAAQAGADMCELDVQATRDGAVVVIHDETVDRTTDGHGAVAGMTLAEIKRLDAGVRFDKHLCGERVPTLEEVFAAVRGRMRLNIELKHGAIERSVCRIIRENRAAGDSLVSSFEWPALSAVRKIDPQVRIGLLADKEPDAMLAAAVAMKAWAVNPRFDMADERFCARAHAHGLKVLVWTVDEPDRMRNLIRAGVDGIMTNYPARLLAALIGL